MAIQRIPIATSYDAESTIGTLTPGSTSSNIIYDRYIDGRPYATQRPAITLSSAVADNPTVDSQGRGVYFWAAANTFITVNNDTVFSGYPTVIGTISAGKDPVYFVENQTQLAIIDPENNQGWYIEQTDPATLLSITDLDFPPNQTPAKSLAGGVVYIDGYICVLDTDGLIWNSALNDVSSWNALDFIGATREIDSGVYIGTHHESIMVVGSKSIEFFFNSGNPTGSPLSRRNDISYRTGCVDRKSIYTTGDIASFIGTEQSGTLGLYEMRGYKLQKKTSLTIDEALSYLGLKVNYDFILSVSLINDHYLTFITPVIAGVSTWDPLFTLVYDEGSKMWSQWSTTLTGISNFSVVSIADKTQGTDRTVTMMLTDGNVIEIDGRLEPIDNTGDSRYFESDDYIENQNDYIELTAGVEEVNIDMSLTLPEVDFGVENNKFGRYLRVLGDTIVNATNSEDISISWSDDHYNTFSNPRNIGTGLRRRITRLGSFKRRAHKIDYDGPDTLRIEAIEMETGVSPYA